MGYLTLKTNCTVNVTSSKYFEHQAMFTKTGDLSHCIYYF
jgi:hypothetical protein